MYLKISKMLGKSNIQFAQVALYYKSSTTSPTDVIYQCWCFHLKEGLERVMFSLGQQRSIIFQSSFRMSYLLVICEMARSEIKVIPATSNLKGLRYDMVLFDEGLNLMGTLTDLRRISRGSHRISFGKETLEEIEFNRQPNSRTKKDS